MKNTKTIRSQLLGVVIDTVLGFTCACDHDTGDLPAYGKRI